MSYDPTMPRLAMSRTGERVPWSSSNGQPCPRFRVPFPMISGTRVLIRNYAPRVVIQRHLSCKIS